MKNKWKYISHIKDIPKGEVFALNNREYSHGFHEVLIGTIYEKNGVLYCENEHEILENVTHYQKIEFPDWPILKDAPLRTYEDPK